MLLMPLKLTAGRVGTAHQKICNELNNILMTNIYGGQCPPYGWLCHIILTIRALNEKQRLD